MKKTFFRILVASILVFAGFSYTTINSVYAEEESSEGASEASKPATSISLTPVNKILQIASNSVYDGDVTINNEGSGELEVEMSAAPYSFVHSEETDSYQLGFSNETNFTQISRWITFKDSNGNYAKTIKIKIAPEDSAKVEYRVTTPESIPAGGQYAVIFARTISNSTSAGGIRTEASPGMIVYGHSTEGETIKTAEISGLAISQSTTEGNTTRNTISATSKVKNTGNVDFNAVGTLRVDPIIGGASYETEEGRGRYVSIIPEAELVVADEWKDTPGFGIYKVTWTVAATDKTETIEQIVVINVIPVIIIIIIVLTIIIVWCIIASKKRKERRSRLAV